MVALAVVAVAVVALLLLDVLVYFFGCDSRDDERGDQHGRYASWIEEAARRRSGVAAAVSSPARHVGSLLRGGDAGTSAQGRPAAARRLAGPRPGLGDA